MAAYRAIRFSFKALRFVKRSPVGLAISFGVMGMMFPSTAFAAQNIDECECENPTPPTGSNIYYHYTNKIGMTGIIASQELLPALKVNNPSDAKYGDGQYLTDIIPHTKSNASLARIFKNVPNKYIYTHYIAIDTTGLEVEFGRPNVYVILNKHPLNISGRIRGNGKNCGDKK